MKKRKYREIYHKNNNVNEVTVNKAKSTTTVEKSKNVERERKGFNVFFDLKDDKKKSSDD